MIEPRDITSKNLVENGFEKHPTIILSNTQQFEVKYTKENEVVTYGGVHWLLNGKKVIYLHEVIGEEK